MGLKFLSRFSLAIVFFFIGIHFATAAEVVNNGMFADRSQETSHDYTGGDEYNCAESGGVVFEKADGEVTCVSTTSIGENTPAEKESDLSSGQPIENKEECWLSDNCQSSNN